MGNAHRERAHHRGTRGPGEAFVELAPGLRDGQLALEIELGTQVPQRNTAEHEDEAGRQRDAEGEPPARPSLAIALTPGARHGRDAPSAQAVHIDPRETRE